MTDINFEINRLLNFAVKNGLISSEDKYYSANLLLDLLHIDEYQPVDIMEDVATAAPILKNILDYSVEQGLIQDTVNQRDLFDTAVMNCIMPRPSEIIRDFKADYQISPVQATDNYYKKSIASNYIRKDRIDKNIIWQTATEFGNLDITINLSKPEKDPRDIAAAKLVKSTSYPKCLLCRENEGFAGHANHPARQTHRIIPMDFHGMEWFFQYSPYTYYNEHCIVFNSQHVPMKISRRTFENLISFLDVLPHYFAGSNADLPIVGGSILSHDHYQGGRYSFAMEKAAVEKEYSFSSYLGVKAGRVKWPMSAIRLISSDKEQLIDLADRILSAWRKYSDEGVNILAHTNGEDHNTITPIARYRDGKYEFDLVLRNNLTSEEHPLGIYHPHAHVHHIKKENIGLIEVLGLAILPARLKWEMAGVKKALLSGAESLEDEALASHANWYKIIKAKHCEVNEENVDDIIRDEIGHVFLEVLTHAGVFKRDEKGLAAFDKFVNSVV